MLRWSSSPITVTSDGSRPTSSWASRSAAWTGVSPGSSRPPGKLISPLWLRMCRDRRVSSTSAPLWPSARATSTADGRASGNAGADGCAGRRRGEDPLDVVDRDRQRVRRRRAQPAGRPHRRPRDLLRASRPSRRIGHQLDGAQPSSASWRRTSGRPGRLEVGQHPARRLLAGLELLPGRDQLLEVGGRSVEGHGRHATGEGRTGSSRTVGAVPHDAGRCRRRPARRSSRWPRCGRRAAPGCGVWRRSNDEFHHTNPRMTAAAAMRARLALSLSSHGRNASDEQDPDDDEVDDAVAAPGEHPERPQRPVDEGGVEDDQPAGQRRHGRVRGSAAPSPRRPAR